MTPQTRSLHTPSQRPYYIEAPAYRRNSAGIRVMHMLCHLLNRCGQDAYIYPTSAINPHWHTPILTPALIQQHAQAGRKPITVYPEVIRGNPRDAGSVVRYLLNKPGFLGGDTHFPGSDLLYAFTRHLLPPGEDSRHVLFMPPIDTSVFNNINNPHDRQRKGWLIYPGRYFDALERYKEIADQCTVITSQWPSSPQEMADLLRQSERVFCFTSTAIATEAILCGCPAIVLPSPHFDGTPLGIEELGTYGLAFSDTPEAIAEAIAQLPTAQKKYTESENRFWEQLDLFIQKTQVMTYTPVVITHAQKIIENKNLPIQNWLNQRRPNGVQSRLINERLEKHANPAPRIAFIILPGKTPEEAKTTQRSLLAQKYSHITVNVAPDADSATLNALATHIPADWVCFVQAGTTVSPTGITPVALELQGAPDCRAVYADEICIGPNGELAPLLRPDLNLDMLLSWPSGMARHWIFRRDVFMHVGGFDSTYVNACEFDLILRLIESSGLAGLAHIHEPLFLANNPELISSELEVAALERHLHTRGYRDASIDSRLPGRYRVVYGHTTEPLVSIIITALDHPDLTRRCLRSILENTGYPNYEIVLLEQKSSATSREEFPELTAEQHERIHIWEHHETNGRTTLQNIGAQRARGEYLLLLNNSTTVLQEGWIDALLNHALRPEVGVVGAKLLNPDGSVQHAGMVLGLGSPAKSPFMGADVNDLGEMHRLQIDQNYSAVSACCLMVRRELYEQVGGLNEQDLSAAYSDVDLCLKIGKFGYLIVWTPHVVLLNAALEPQAMDPAAEDFIYSRWKAEISKDPAYNQNLSLSGRGFELEMSPDVGNAPLSWRPLPTILALIGTEKNSAHYRIMHPAISASAAGLADTRLSQQNFLPAEMERLQPAAWILQNMGDEYQIEQLKKQSKLIDTFKVAELSEYLFATPAPNQDFLGEIRSVLSRCGSLVDRILLPTAELADALGSLHPDMRVIPSLLPPIWWSDLGRTRRLAERPRVGWVGNDAELNDLALITGVVEALSKEVEWVFLGACPASLRPFLHEKHDAVSIEEYPSKLASLNLHLALAPLAPTLLNECKGVMRLLEYGACGYPVICSDLPPYRNAQLPVTRVRNRTEDWIEAIRMHITDLDASAVAGATLRHKVQSEWMLEGPRLEAWIQAWLPN